MNMLDTVSTDELVTELAKRLDSFVFAYRFPDNNKDLPYEVLFGENLIESVGLLEVAKIHSKSHIKSLIIIEDDDDEFEDYLT